MYIVLENLTFDHPALNSPLEILDQYQYGAFGVAHIADANLSQVDLTQLNYVEVSETTARAAKFAKSSGGTISILKGSEIHDEMIIHSSEDLVTHPTKPKVKYTLTDTDNAQLTDYFKALMLLMINTHYKNLSQDVAERNANLKASIIAEINACSTLLQARDLMHNKFGVSTSSVVQEENNWGTPTVNLSI